MAKLRVGRDISSEAQCKATLNSIADALYVIGGKWKLRIIVALTDGNKRFNELQRLIGASVWLEGERAQVDQTVCQIPLYKSDHFSVGELARKLGSDIKLPELQSDQVDLIYVKCEGGGWRPAQSMLVKLPEGRMLMLWKGVFLTLKRT